MYCLSISKRDKSTIIPNLNAKSVDFPVTGEAMLEQTPVICR